MEGNVLLSNFNSYFELLIAFAFAYGGLNGFKNYINKVSFRDYNLNYEKQLRDTLNAIENVSFNSRLLEHFSSKIQSLKDDNAKIASIEKIAMGFYDGTYFQPMFFLVGLIYLFFLIVGGFQVNIGSSTLFMFILFVFVLSLAYYILVYYMLRSHAKKIKSLEKKWWLQSYTVLRIFFFCILGLLILAGITSFELRGHPCLVDGDVFKGFFCECRMSTLCEVLGIILALSLSFCPYLMYYFRERLFLRWLEKEFNEKKEKAEKELSELSELILAVRDTLIIKTS